MAASKTSYAIEQARLQSFGPKGRSQWPHPTKFSVTPRSLASAGFIYSPADDAEDSARCFCCDKQLGGWEEGDTALDQHLQHTNNTCSFARMRAIQEARIADEEGWHEDSANAWMLDMHSTEAVEMRKATFSAGGYKWPYDKKKGWKPTSAALAAAGFSLHMKELGDEDTAECIYCGVRLSGWEKTDDPLAEHRRRATGDSCIFLSGLSGEPEDVDVATEPVSKATSSAASKKKRASRKTPAPASSTAAVSDGEGDSQQPKSKRKTRGGRSVAASEDEEPPSQPSRASRRGDPSSGKTTRSRSKEANLDKLAEEDKPTKPARKPRAKKSKAVKEPSPEPEPEEEEGPAYEIQVEVETKLDSSPTARKRPSSPIVEEAVAPPKKKKRSKDKAAAEDAAAAAEVQPVQKPAEEPVEVIEEVAEPLAEPTPAPQEDAMEEEPVERPAEEEQMVEEPRSPSPIVEQPASAAQQTESNAASTLSAEQRRMPLRDFYEHLAQQALIRTEDNLRNQLKIFDDKAAMARKELEAVFDRSSTGSTL